MRPPAAQAQLDIFGDSRDAVLRDDVLHALDRDDATAARSALEALAAECPGDPALASFDVLTQALLVRCDAPFADHGALARERLAATDRLGPAAAAVMGAAAGRAWTERLWRRLATRAEPLAYRAGRPDGQAAALWSAAGAWSEAERAVKRIESWRRIPAPLGWMLEATLRLARRDEAWPLLAETRLAGTGTPR